MPSYTAEKEMVYRIYNEEDGTHIRISYDHEADSCYIRYSDNSFEDWLSDEQVQLLIEVFQNYLDTRPKSSQ